MSSSSSTSSSSSARMLEKNKGTYIKDRNSLGQVAVPTTAMQEGGTEYRLIAAVVSVLFLISLPPAFLLYCLVYTSVVLSDFFRFGASLLSFILYMVPIYFMPRYVPGRAFAFFMFVRQFALPMLVGIAAESPILSLVLLSGNLVLAWLRKKVTPPPTTTDSNRLNILLVCDALPPKVDGVATFCTNMVQSLQERHNLRIVTSISGSPDLLGVPIVRLPGMPTKISPGHSITFPLPFLLLPTLFSFPPHIIHLFEVSPLNLSLCYFAHVLDIPITFSHHTRLDLYINIVTPLLPTRVNSWILSLLEFTFYALPDAHLCVSRVLFDTVQNRLGKHCFLWSSGVNPEFDRNKFNMETRAYLTGGDVHLPLVCHVGRLGPEKNSDELASMFRETWLLMHGRVRFVIVGEGISREQISKELQEHGVRCEFVGFQRGLVLHQSFASCDVFFSPSTTEGFPLVFLEAMRSGLAVVGARAGGVPDCFENEVEGVLFDPHDGKSAAKALKRAIEGGREMRDRATERGKQYSWEKSSLEFEHVLLNVVARKREAATGWWF